MIQPKRSATPVAQVRRRFDLLVVVHPVDWEVYHEQWAWEFGSLVAALERDPGTHVLNLLEYA